MLPQVCNHVRNPNVTLPRGLFYGCILSVLISLLAVIACAGISPGYGEDFAAVGYPMDQILYEVYGIPARISDIIFVLSSNLLCVFSLMYSSGHQMGALAKSGLLPPFMGLTYGPHNVPYVALLVSTLLQFTVCCVIHFKYMDFRPYLVLFIAALFVYLGVFAAYIVFSTRFKNMQRHWYSPLGIAGAVVGIGIDVGGAVPTPRTTTTHRDTPRDTRKLRFLQATEAGATQAAAGASVAGVRGAMGQNPHVVIKEALVHEGLQPEQSLLPLRWNT
eukprot:gene11005-14080_t